MIKFKFEDIEIPESNPFQNCQLGRQEYATILENIVAYGKDGYVMSLDGAWGSGKTTFAKMWQQQLKNNGFTTIYFNAWEHDYMVDPLVALIGELHKISTNDKLQMSFAKVVANAGKIFSGILPSIGKTIAKKYVGEEAVDIIKDTLSETKKLFQHELDKYKEECDSIETFRLSLANFATDLAPEKPLVFIVDELDRCNPTFAVKVLERIKHLFAIPHIVFVLAIDKEQLCNSICGFYGSDSINAAEYLRRFIDVEYYLPAPDYETFFDYIYNKLGLDDFFMKITRGNGYDTISYQHALKSFPLKLLASKKLSLRQVEKFMLHMRLALQTIPVDYAPYPALIAFLIYLRQYERPLYSDIQSRSMTIQQLMDKLESIIPEELYSSRDKYDTQTERSTVYVVAQLLVAYASDYRGIEWTDLLKETNEEKKQLTFETHLPKDDLEEIITHYSSRNYIVNLEYVVRHIELLCNLQNE